MNTPKRRVLVIGSGGREHAMIVALAQSEDVTLFCAPGNPGTASLATNLDASATDVAALAAMAKAHAIDLVIPGPEATLSLGIADELARVAIPCVGPSQAAARLESSKVFMRELTAPLRIPAPQCVVVRSVSELSAALGRFASPPVVKADGLAAGKGVFLPDGFDECRQVAAALLEGKLGEAGRQILIEERLCGVEVSLFFACHHETAVALPHARDHKRLGDSDEGPNTGGMGAVSPNPAIDADGVDKVQREFVLPVLRALCQKGCPFVGFLFVGLMMTADGPKLLECNVRLGDPEAQAILPRLGKGEFLRLCEAMVRGQLEHFVLNQLPDATCAVVLAASGYPEVARAGDEITIVADALQKSGASLVYGGTQKQNGVLTTAGGRVLTVVGQGKTPCLARRAAYAGVSAVRFSGMQYRRDIGGRETENPWVSVIMGSTSDHSVMSEATALLRELEIPHEVRVVSAHRTPEWMFQFAKEAESRGLEVIIAAAGGAAHLPGMVASLTTVPVLGVPIAATALQGMDALLSIVQMPRGVPVGTLAIGAPGAANAAFLAAEICALSRPSLRDRLHRVRNSQRDRVLAVSDSLNPSQGSA